MNPWKTRFIVAAVAVLFSIPAARAQYTTYDSAWYEETEESSDAEPMTLRTPRASDESVPGPTPSASHGTEGFWIFPEPAPLEGKIATDRPGFSDTAALVPRGRFQIEGGYTFTYDREGKRRVQDHQMPEIAFRTGLTDWLEFRAKWNGYSYSEVLDVVRSRDGRRVSRKDHVDGGSDLNLGFKMPLLSADHGAPLNLSIIPSLYVPTGSGSKSANNVVPEIKFPWNYAVYDRITLFGSILGRVQDGSNGQFYQTAVTLGAGYAMTDWMTLYTEYFGVYPAIRNEDCSHLLSAGPIFRITDNLSVDVRVAAGLNEQAPDFQTSIGFGIRY
jgi:hypothetical protein